MDSKSMSENMDEGEDYFNQYLVGMVRSGVAEPKNKVRDLLAQARLYANHARSAVIGEHGFIAERYLWEPELGKSATFYADRSLRLTAAALGILQANPEMEK